MNTKFLKQYLDNKKCFKLICGAGNKNFNEIKNLCFLYAKAGCRFFDVNASIEAVKAAKDGFKSAGKENECFLCISVGTKNDIHLKKCKINSQKCIQCGLCKNICSEKAISIIDNKVIIDETKCIGCQKCILICNSNAIENYSTEINFEEILPEIIKQGIDCIEYHINSENEDEILSGWNSIIKLYKGALSVCIDRSKLGNEQLIKRLTKMKNKCDNLFMVQADGIAMSGGSNDYNSTLQAVATADIIAKSDITPYIIMSGGTNSKTMELARQCDVNVSGFAAGSYARKIVKEYIEQKDFLENEVLYIKALEIAKKLVNTML